MIAEVVEVVQSSGAPSWAETVVLLITAVTALLVALSKFQASAKEKREDQEKAVIAVASAAKAAKVDEVATKLAEVTATTETKLTALADTATSTHALVSAAHGQSLKVAAVALRRVASLTKSPEDVKAAEETEKALAEHEAKSAP